MGVGGCGDSLSPVAWTTPFLRSPALRVEAADFLDRSDPNLSFMQTGGALEPRIHLKVRENWSL